jgi:hypothetical protein
MHQLRNRVTRPACRLAAALTATIVAATPMLLSPTAAWAAPNHTVVSGATWQVPQTTRLASLTLCTGGLISAPPGHSITLTVNGVETGQKLVTTAGVETTIQPGTYRGAVVLSVTETTTTSWFGTVFPIRQALRVNADGVNENQSALAAITGGTIAGGTIVRGAMSGGSPAGGSPFGGTVTDSEAQNIAVVSKGEGFNGIYIQNAKYQLVNPQLRLTGNGRFDFVGAGAAIVGSGTGTRLIVDRANIDNTGVVRTGVVATDGSNVIVKNSTIRTHDGQLPADYAPTLLPGQMRSAPWMLGIVGNVRATNLVGTDTKATYLNSDVYSTGWGVLSTDSTDRGQLTAINTRITTGTEGYGAYADGHTVTDRFLGSSFDVDDYAVISTGGTVLLGDSDPAAVAGLNTSLDLGLDQRELVAVPTRNTTVTSGRFGVMWHGGGSADADGGTVSISGGTTIRTAKTTFVDKGLPVRLNIDGSHGATIQAGNGVLWQLMESDDPGPVMVNGNLVNQGVYQEPTSPPDRNSNFDVATTHPTDAVANLNDLTLRGDFYNGMRNPRNLVLNLNTTHLTGAVTSSTTHHAVDTITAVDYRQISEVTNTATPTTNNGVILTLTDGSTWTATGTSYLSSLTIDATSTISGANRGAITMTVNGVPTQIIPGTTYTGAIVIATSSASLENGTGR